MTENMKSLGKSIDLVERKIKEREKKNRQEKHDEARKRKEFWEKEDERFAEKLELAESIFKWADNFSDSEQYAKLDNFDFSSLKGDGSGLWVYTGNWGHEMKKGRQGRWSRLHLLEDGSLLYKVGYKWMYPTREPIHFKDPEKLARSLSNDYLEKLKSAIDSGEIVKRLRGKLEEGLKS